ncbi:MAG: Unknown protein [uncultured Thiotrichaceae bacterium]|uniref:Zinc resistance-associated protein n=1 Tax=uncultured Thiotrichaceae bacterium TaxID=298394 RepID=A0A6S6S7I2_9GAMM|nr:MAG: Unknown protein [uncultured Thiotrichaceae bacterium]
MLKQTLVVGIMSLSFIISAPAMARGNHDSQRISPTNHHANHHQPRHARHCVPGHRINNRQDRQRSRIRQGVRSGQLVHWEREQLKQQQRRIKNKENRMRRDGCLTRDESRRLMNRLDRAGQKIRALKSNNIRRHHGHRNNH